MKKGNMIKGKKILVSIFSLLLCVLVTFAWINELQNHRGRVMALRLTNASIGTSEVDIKLFVNINDDEFKEITSPYQENKEPDLESYENFAPGSRMKFKVEITNKSEAVLRLSMILSEIVCENQELADSIIIGTNGFEGFDNNYPAPQVQNKLLSEGLNDGGGFTLVELVELPPKVSEETNNTVTIYFYVMFSASGSANLEDLKFSIGKLNFLTL